MRGPYGPEQQSTDGVGWNPISSKTKTYSYEVYWYEGELFEGIPQGDKICRQGRSHRGRLDGIALLAQTTGIFTETWSPSLPEA
jgi:hypothetical protein